MRIEALPNSPSRSAADAVPALACRFCNIELTHVVVDLGASPLANNYLTLEQTRAAELFYPLKVFVCAGCFLVQLQMQQTPERIFSDYAYFSSYTDSWVRHARAYTELVIDRFGLSERSLIVEIASNDGYLLRHFVARGIPVLGIEPAANVARVAEQNRVPTCVEFFSESLARALAAARRADLIVANNVLAHVPALNDFVGGIAQLLKPRGVVTVECPHLMRLMEENQFDTIYHEHFSYFSLHTMQAVFAAHGLAIFDVQELPTHGGSLRVFATHAGESGRKAGPAVQRLLQREEAAGLQSLAYYAAFADRVKTSKRQLLSFLIAAKDAGKSIVGYGAPAKGNTLLNYCGIRSDFLDYTVDRSPHKQGRFLPGTHVPIYAPDEIAVSRPDYVLILPWNVKDEVMEQMAHIREWGGEFVVPIPSVQILP
jgi:SAM-dependent methyltransferase